MLGGTLFSPHGYDCSFPRVWKHNDCHASWNRKNKRGLPLCLKQMLFCLESRIFQIPLWKWCNYLCLPNHLKHKGEYRLFFRFHEACQSMFTPALWRWGFSHWIMTKNDAKTRHDLISNNCCVVWFPFQKNTNPGPKPGYPRNVRARCQDNGNADSGKNEKSK